jgi:AcrR family transcriptional regulator
MAWHGTKVIEAPGQCIFEVRQPNRADVRIGNARSFAANHIKVCHSVHLRTGRRRREAGHAGFLTSLPAESRKPQIVHVVLQLVVERGADSVSAQLIADAIGVTQPAIFRHFPTKEAIWLAVMDWLEDRLGEIYRAADSEGAALAVLSRMFLEHVRLVERHPALAKLVFSDHLRLQYPSLQKRFVKIHRGYEARVAGLIERAKAQGAVPKTLRAADAVILFCA